MPEVLATGYMVGFIEWACIQAINPHLNWPEEQTVGTHIDVSHLAATPPGLEVVARVKLVEVDRIMCTGTRLTARKGITGYSRPSRLRPLPPPSGAASTSSLPGIFLGEPGGEIKEEI